MQPNDGLASEAGSSSSIQQVMGGPSSGTSGVQTRSQIRGRAKGADNRTPISAARALGGTIWTAASAAASSASPSSGGPTEAMVALQQKMELMLIQNQEQARRHTELLALFGSQQQMVQDLQTQLRALTEDAAGSSRPPAPSEDAPVQEPRDFASSSESIPVGVPVQRGTSSREGDRKIQFEDEEREEEYDEDDNGDAEEKHSDRPPRPSNWSWALKHERAASAMELAKIQAFNKSSDDLVKTLPKFDESGYPRWRDKTLSILAQRGCKDVVLLEADPPDVSSELLAAQRRNAWLLLENSLERAN